MSKQRRPRALLIAEFRERIRVFLAAVQAGASDASAAAEAGISRQTIHRWQNDERPIDQIMRKQLQRARAIRERRWLGMIENAAVGQTVTAPNGRVRGVPGDWKAAAWLLERTNNEFAQPQRVEVSGLGGGPVRHEVEHALAVPDENRVKRVMELLATAGKVPQLESSGNGNGAHGTNGHS